MSHQQEEEGNGPARTHTRKKLRLGSREPDSLVEICIKSLASHTDRLVSMEGIPMEYRLALYHQCFFSANEKETLNATRPRMLQRLKPFLQPSILTALDLSFVSHQSMNNNEWDMLVSYLSDAGAQALKFPQCTPAGAIKRFAQSCNADLLTALDLSGISALSVDDLFSVSHYLQNIQELKVRRCLLEGDPKALTGTVGIGMPNLRKLDLSGIGTAAVTDKAISCMCQSLKILEEFYLNGCWRLTGDALVAIGRELKELRVLDIGNISAFDNYALVELQGCTNLRSLILKTTKPPSRQEIKYSSLALLRVAQHCSLLTTIDLRGIAHELATDFSSIWTGRTINILTTLDSSDGPDHEARNLASLLLSAKEKI